MRQGNISQVSKSTNSNRIFSNRDIYNIFIPLLFEQALAITVGMADTMMISSVGESAVSGVSLIDMFNMLIFSILSALATGGAVIVSQNLGAGKQKEAKDAAKQLLFAGVVASLLLGLFSILFRQGILSLFFGKIEPAVREAALIYLVISAISFPFLGLYNGCAALFRAMGRTSVTFKVSVIGNIINVVGNAVCIFGLKMGVAGVAIPSLLSRAVMGIILYLLLKKPSYEIYLEPGAFRLNGEIIKKILYIGIPSGIENGIFQLGRVLVVSIISGFGTMQIAANGVANSIDNCGSLVGSAMNLAMITVIGRCVGADDKEQIRYYMKKLLFIAYGLTAVLNIPVLLGLQPILAIFGLSAETTALATKLIWIHNGVAMLLWPMSFTFPNMLRACNDVKFTMFLSILSMFLCRVGFSYLLGVRYGMGAIGVWIAMVIDWIVRITGFVLRYLHGDWKTLMYKLK